MKTIISLFILTLACNIIQAQESSATTHSEFNFQGKLYIADYDVTKHLLKMNEEVSFQIYDETGICIKRSEGITIDFKPILKAGEEKTFVVRFYKNSQKSKKKKKASIKHKGEIGVMVIKDQK
jgi:hypothetical protein